MVDTPVIDLITRHPFSATELAGAAKLAIAPLIPADIAAVSDMTFPAFRPHLAGCLTGEAHDGFEFFARVARDDDLPVGLVLASAEAEGEANTARLLSISVIPACRQRGVASRLMLSLEDELRRLGCTRLATGYTTRMPAYRSLERLLAACGWSPPETDMVMSTGYCREVVKAPWVSAFHEAPAGFELFEWTQLSAAERIQLQHDVASGQIPRGLSPFADEADCEPAISVGVRHNGEVVAWMIVIRSPWMPNALCYRSKYVRPQLRAGHALGPLTLAEAIRRHTTSPIEAERPVGVFGMSFKNATKMTNFFRKRLAPFCFNTYESRTAMKTLA